MAETTELANQRENELQFNLEKKIEKALARFTLFFDNRLRKGLARLIINSPQGFVSSRSLPHLQTILIAQFLLQKRMEASLATEGGMQNPIVLKLFKRPSRICMALAFLDSYRFRREQLIKAVKHLMPGVQEIPRSFFLWHHPELPYLFCYFEVQKLRGEEIPARELKRLACVLKEQLQTAPPLTPALFWPYNEEESYRQVLLLLKEMSSVEDLPHISLHFQEQTPTSLEFLIHLARPKSPESLNRTLERLPDHLDFFCQFHYISKKPFPIELGAFTLKVPSHVFDVRDSINLLYARRYVMKCMEGLLGSCRDYNGGLFEKQQQHFEVIRVHLSDKIPLFDLFAEKVFYALHPVERRLMLSLEETEELLRAFSNLLQGNNQLSEYSQTENVMIVRAAKSSDLHRLSHQCKESKQTVCHAQLSFGGFHYLCILGPGATQIKSMVKNRDRGYPQTKILRLILQEGEPNSLNPYHTSGDMRCRLLSKLLYEGLTRLNPQGEPELTGAESCISSQHKVFTFKLRPNRWSNGERVTAIDYAGSMQKALKDRLSHPEIHYIIKNAQKFKEKKVDASELGIKAIDTQTLQIELEYANPRFLHQLAQPFFFPIFASMQEPKWFNGPFLVREQTKEGILLERNPYYWKKEKLYFEEIEFKWIQNVDQIYNLFQEGKTDWIGDPLSTLSPDLIQELDKQGELRKQDVSRSFLLFYNAKHPILSSPSIRRALSLSIDRDLICNTIYTHCAALFPQQPSKEEANFYFEKGLSELGLTRESFPILTFSHSDHTKREQLASCLQSVWKEVLGIQIGIEKISWNQFRNRLEKGLFEISGTIQDTQNADSPQFLERFEGKSSWNFSKWENLEYRKLIIDAKKEVNEVEHRKLLTQAEQILLQEAPFTPLFKYIHLYAHTPQLRGYLIDHEGCIDFSQSFLQKKRPPPDFHTL